MAQQLIERINNLFINMSSTMNQLNYMKKMLTLSNSEEVIKESNSELKRMTRFFELTTLGSSIFPFGTQYVYVWELEDKKYYIGWSENLSRRLDEHLSEDGAAWTKQHKPIAILEIIRGDKNLEKKKTLEYMKAKGFQNVRGSVWCCLEYSFVPKEVQKYLLGEPLITNAICN